MYQLYGQQNSGAAAIEAALELCAIPYRFIDVAGSAEAAHALEKLNPMKQIPTLELPDGNILTESAAILIHLGLTFPSSGLLPDNPVERDQVIRGLVYIVCNCYQAIGSSTTPSAGWPRLTNRPGKTSWPALVRDCIGVGRCLPISFPASCTWAMKRREHWTC